MYDRIKQLRSSLGLTQLQFAERIGLSRNYIALIETGAREPSDHTISDICREFGVSMAWLQDGIGEMYVKRTMNEEIAMMTTDLMTEENDSFRKRFISSMLELPLDFWPEFERFLKKTTGGV